jgi:hypothetical protein
LLSAIFADSGLEIVNFSFVTNENADENAATVTCDADPAALP